MCATLAHLPIFLQDLFLHCPEELNDELGFCQRRRALTPSAFVRTLVFGWLDNPTASLDDLADYASTLGKPISGSGLRQQLLKPTAPQLLQGVLDHALQPLLFGTQAPIPLLQRFQGVYVFDTSIFSLPACLAQHYPGCGNQNQQKNAACKVLFGLELTSGGLVQLEFFSARDPDQGLFPLCQPLPEGALALRDLGFFAAQRLQEQTELGVWWLTRAQPQLVVQLGKGQTQGLLPFLRGRGATVDLPEVEVGTKVRLRCRLLAWRVPDAVAERRKQKRQEQRARKYRRRRRAQQRGKKVSKGCGGQGKKRVVPAVPAEQLEWCEWVVVLTNVPADKLSVPEAQALLRARWQIELLIKVWKQSGCLEKLRGTKRERVECELLAKVLGQLVAHWAVLSSGRVYLAVNVPQATRKVKKYAERLGQALGRSEAAFREVWEELLGRIRRTRRRRRGQKRPSTEQRLLGEQPPWWSDEADSS
jgi:hypothetical protein